ncbi:hypothetical protein [Thermomonas brevis]
MSEKITTREGITVAVGQVWKDLDRRVKRTVKVERVDELNGIAHVVSTNGAKSKISIKRMYKHGQGFSLVDG